jgi:hypothetical protein
MVDDGRRQRVRAPGRRLPGTAPQRVLLRCAGWLAVAAVLVVPFACQRRPPEPPPRGGGYARLGCAGCHGPRGEGTPGAPALDRLRRHWDGERLAAYLRDPEAVKRGDPRLTAQAGSFQLVMPAVKGATDGELRELARELLADAGKG